MFDFQVNFELRRLADSKGPDGKRFSLLANSVEEFTTCLLEPLRSDERGREEFGDGLDEILEDAIQLEQKKVRLQKKKKRSAQAKYNFFSSPISHHFF